MSPYDVSALRELGDLLERDPSALTDDPPMVYLDKTRGKGGREEVELAGGVREEDLPYRPEYHDQDSASEEVNWAEECLWCNEQWKKDSKLLLAARSGDLEMLTVAMEGGAHATCTDYTHMNWTAMHYAAFYGYADIVERLYDYGGDVDARDLLQWTPLHHAALKGRADCCLALLSLGASPWALTEQKKTPLQKAVYLYHVECIEVLCEWMRLPAANFTADQPPSPEEMQAAMDMEGQEEEDEEEEGGGGGAAGRTEADPEEEIGVEAELTAEEEANKAEIRAEYERRFRESKNMASGGRK